MKHTRLSATSAVAVIAAGLAVGVATPANAAPAKAERITSTAQLHESLAKAIELEQVTSGELGPGTVGRVSAATISTDPVGRAASATVPDPELSVALQGIRTSSGTFSPAC